MVFVITTSTESSRGANNSCRLFNSSFLWFKEAVRFSTCSLNASLTDSSLFWLIRTVAAISSNLVERSCSSKGAVSLNTSSILEIFPVFSNALNCSINLWTASLSCLPRTVPTTKAARIATKRKIPEVVSEERSCLSRIARGWPTAKSRSPGETFIAVITWASFRFLSVLQTAGEFCIFSAASL